MNYKTLLLKKSNKSLMVKIRIKLILVLNIAKSKKGTKSHIFQVKFNLR